MKFYKILFTFYLLCMTTLTFGQSNSTIKPVLNAYFGLKDALVASNNAQAIQNANILDKALAAVNETDLNSSTKAVWVKIASDLKSNSASIASSSDISTQRGFFVMLSTNMYSLVKEVKSEIPVYYQFCPMANKGKGANWLSLENKVKNPYYGSMMLSCGKVVETL